ncbi:MAG: ABC transporter permease [Bacteroidales bacterium]
MRVLGFLLEKEFKQILRNKIIVPMIIVLPTIQLLILPFAATFEIKNIDVVVVDKDHSSYSQRLIKKIAASNYFELRGISNSYPEAQTIVDDNRASIILELPKDFEKKLVKGEKGSVFIAADAIDGTKGGMGASYMGQIVQDFTQELFADGTQIPKGLNKTPQIIIETQFRYNPLLNYKTYMVPGIMVMLLTLVGGILAALNIVSEREQGTLEQMNVTPLKKQYYLLAKLIPFWIMGFITLNIGLLVAWLLFGIVPLGNIFTLYLFATIYMIAFTGFGLLISTAVETQQQSMFISFFFLMIFFLMGGLFTPIGSMPQWAQNITYLIPTRYMTEVMRLIILKGSEFKDLLPQFAAICGFAVIFNAWAIVNYKKTN